MKAMVLKRPGPIETNPLKMTRVPDPKPGPGEILIEVSACGICHTDLHIVEGEVPPKKLPITPGHQIVGTVEAMGQGAIRFKSGDRVGVPWLYSACGSCTFCRRGDENLCDEARFTGYHADGGYAEYTVVREDFAYPIPKDFSDLQAAPLLCAGIIGYRALRLAEVKRGTRVGLYGFGASAHIAIQVLVHWDCEVFVFSRSVEHQELARRLGAAWVGRAEEEPPARLHSAIVFAPVGKLALDALRVVDKGGTIALAGIYMTPIPEMDYTQHLYYEKTIRSVTNSTRRDGEELLHLASQIPIRTEVQVFGLGEANQALKLLKEGNIQGAGVLEVSS